MKTSCFSASLALANRRSPDEVARLLRDQGVRHIRGVTLRPSVAHDRLGIDYVAHRSGDRRPLFIDLKEISYSRTSDATPHVLLETARQGQARAPGWATDDSKLTDLFLFAYRDGSALVLSARQVRAAWAKYGGAWSRQYRTGRTATEGFYETFSTEYVLVPQGVLSSACAEIAAAWRRRPGGGDQPPPRVPWPHFARPDHPDTSAWATLLSPGADGRAWLIERIEGLQYELNRVVPWPGERMSLSELEQMEEHLTDEIVSDGFRPFPETPVTGLAGLIDPLTDYVGIKSHGKFMDHCAPAYNGEILSELAYLYAVRLPESATLVLSRPALGCRWRIASLVAAHDTQVRRETRALVEGWLAARAGFSSSELSPGQLIRSKGSLPISHDDTRDDDRGARSSPRGTLDPWRCHPGRSSRSMSPR